MEIQTEHLTLVLQSTEDALAWVESLDPLTRAELSPAWVEMIRTARSAEPWTHGFKLMHRDSGLPVGSCLYKGAPDPEGIVEIAYGIEPEHQGKGYATEAAQALVTHAFAFAGVTRVRAHTRLDGDASMRILEKCGFERVGEVVDPEDGLVCRWEKRRRVGS